MSKFYSISELYDTTEFDDDFLACFRNLRESSRKRVLEKNSVLKTYLEAGNENDYDLIDFGCDRINIKKLYVREKKECNNICPIHGCMLESKNVVVKMEGKSRGMYLFTCKQCKRIYSNSIDENIDTFRKLEIPYQVINAEDYINEKA